MFSWYTLVDVITIVPSFLAYFVTNLGWAPNFLRMLR